MENLNLSTWFFSGAALGVIIFIADTVYNHYQRNSKERIKEYQDISDGARMVRIEQEKINIQAAKTSHFLHLVLSFISCGLWLPVWFLVASINTKAKTKAKEELEDLVKTVS